MSSLQSRAGGLGHGGVEGAGAAGFGLDQEQLERLVAEIERIRTEVVEQAKAEAGMQLISPGRDAISRQNAQQSAVAAADRNTYVSAVVRACDQQLEMLRATLRDYAATEAANTMRT